MNPNRNYLWKNTRLYIRLATSYIFANRLYFIVGIIVSVLLISFSSQIKGLVNIKRPHTIGLAGNFTISSLPLQVQNLVSLGLTQFQPDGQTAPALAQSWQATDSGRKVIFTLKPDIKWQDGTIFNSAQINYNLKSVELNRPASNIIEFIFKEPFAPLPTIVAQPLFKDGLVGLGIYKIDGLKFNGRFISQINLQTNNKEKLIFKFYPTEKDLITALKLRSVDEIQGVHDIAPIGKTSNYKVVESVDKQIVVTLFFNTQNQLLADKQVRQALTYTLPDNYPGYDKAIGPVPLGSWYTSDSMKIYSQNLDYAKKTLEKIASGPGKIKLTIQTSKTLEKIANQIAGLWLQIGVNTNVEITDILPDNYQVYITYLELPVDPDQYALWHSTQQGNISHYKSPKIDKLLEEGRRTLNIADRLDIYANFQKAITEDVPATFLYYPKIYSVSQRI